MRYKLLLEQAENLIKEQPNLVAIMANSAAFLFEQIDKLNWAGFYIFDGKQLTVGPFIGKVACSVIPIGRGVCGTAYQQQKTMVVADVHKIDNHIACDANSASEVVIPIMKDNRIFGVLDIDSPIVNRFDSELVSFLEQFAKILNKYIDF